jgi:hypothetical protein
LEVHIAVAHEGTELGRAAVYADRLSIGSGY